MSSDLDRRSANTLIRRELQLFEELGSLMSLPPDERRRLLALSESEWSAWIRFQRDGALPSGTYLPEMLIRLATAAYGMALTLEPELVDEDAYA